jgi:hypothetical protein
MVTPFAGAGFRFVPFCIMSGIAAPVSASGRCSKSWNYRSPFVNFHYIGTSSCLPGFATNIHFACMLYEKLTGDRFYRPTVL